jgi:hypothetical protein
MQHLADRSPTLPTFQLNDDIDRITNLPYNCIPCDVGSSLDEKQG